MAAQYESWTLPVSVLLGLPIAVFGAFLTLYLRRFDNNVYAQIGLVMLIGLSSKNAILIVEFAKIEYDKGKSLIDATLTGARVRLRPILMTAFAFILGCVPLWRAFGAGAISRQVLGTTVIGGMLASTVIAIFFVPVSFDVVERFGNLFSKEKEKPQPLPQPALSVEPKGGHALMRTKMRTGTSSLGLILLLSLSGCKVGPNYKRPTLDVPGQYRGTAPDLPQQPAGGPFGEMKWPDRLSGRNSAGTAQGSAHQQLRHSIAATRILQAQANLGITRANQFPTVGGVGSIQNEQSTPLFTGSPWIDTLGLQMNYIVDFWGQYRRATEAARANLLASKYAQNVVQITLISEHSQRLFPASPIRRPAGDFQTNCRCR